MQEAGSLLREGAKGMKALTICQPYPWLIIHGGKTIENRTWPTAYRGPLVIHAGKSRKYIDSIEELVAAGVSMLASPDDYCYGVIQGIVDLVDCVPYAHPSVADNPWREGPWCWVLENPRAVAPLTYRGERGLWDMPDACIRAAIEAEKVT